MNKIIVFSLFHRQNFVVPTEYAKEIKYTDARSIVIIILIIIIIIIIIIIN